MDFVLCISCLVLRVCFVCALHCLRLCYLYLIGINQVITMEDSDEVRESSENQQNEQVCSFFRKPVNKKNMRKRTIDNEDDEEESNKESSRLHVQKRTLKPDNKLYFSTGSSKSSASAEPNARAIRERALKQAAETLKGKGAISEDEKLYKGINSYKDYKAGFRREQTIASEKAGGAHGPLRASAHIRVSARFDYQPDICKDYKETGYCGYGDA
ncbi:hypothetical protein VNO77_01207 [Canavalia gladiata]|uniref:C3H1-type domain-containing protein n=1 Tax=Canavalia gladiata TaxID=3824 RepID=A0AAN9R624_CANGL